MSAVQNVTDINICISGHKYKLMNMHFKNQNASCLEKEYAEANRIMCDTGGILKVSFQHIPN